MKNNQIFTIFTLALLFLLSCMQDEKVKQDYHGYTPFSEDDAWTISSPENENMSRSFLEKAYRLVYDEDRFIMARSLLVVRNGNLVAEAYPHDDKDRYQIQNIQSATKSFTSILTGIALQEGILDSVEQAFSAIYPENFSGHPDKTSITIEDALTMRTGIDFDDDENTLELYQEEGSSLDYILSLPMKYEPGVVFHYNDGNPHLVSAAIGKRSGMSLADFADSRLFEPLQISDWLWESTKDGITLGAVSLFLKPRDCAKFGQLLLNNGLWEGQQLVDSSWIARATSPLVNADASGASYGYYFWVYPAYPAYSAIGHGGQRIFIMPSLKLVIVYTAWPYTSSKLFDDFSELSDLIIKSCY
jgi:CubicO group peptidase (beta-lactamase class C family)